MGGIQPVLGSGGRRFSVMAVMYDGTHQPSWLLRFNVQLFGRIAFRQTLAVGPSSAVFPRVGGPCRARQTDRRQAARPRAAAER